MIEITNPYANELMYENGDVITSKHDKQNHGYGLKSMQEIVSRYDGIMDYRAEDSVFNLKFVFQNNE